MATIVTRDNVEDVGRILVEENVRSVLYRYGGRLGTTKNRQRPHIALPIVSNATARLPGYEAATWEITD
jgi:hypothetical protein